MPANDATSKGLVLVVDDEAAIRDSLRMILEYEGYRVEEASGGAEAVAKVASLAPQAIILDIKMPEIDGLEVLRVLGNRGYDIP
ncbi:MAG TPA: response regulator, partial [Thermoanaerobaculia bacterium]|nr:response regulator [Thermoanaerobaculia bacterium]